MRTTLFSIFFISLLLLTACKSQPVESPTLYFSQPWVYTDLRLIDSADTDYPAQDLIAIYLRLTGKRSLFGLWQERNEAQRLEIRLDFLDLEYVPEGDIYIAIDHHSGGDRTLPFGIEADIDWDTLLVIPAIGTVQALETNLQYQRNMAIRIIRDPTLDTITLSLSADALPERGFSLQVQAFTTPSQETILIDQTKPFSLHGQPPPRAQLFLAFWNTYPAYTPALALRRWDGAHTGPLGGRHGLYNLLRSARNHAIPLALLDLKTPVSLSALDYGQGIELVRTMSIQNLLLLPDSIPFSFPSGSQEQIALSSLPSDLYDAAALTSRQSALDFGLPASQFLFGPDIPPGITGYTHYFAPLQTQETNTHLYTHGTKRVLPIPHSPLLLGAEPQASLSGPSLAVRRLLVENALSSNSPAPILVLGGSLPATEWGDPQIARETFRYLSSRPWIHILDTHDIQVLTSSGPISTPALEEIKNAGLNLSLATLPPRSNIQNPLASEAWHTFLNLLTPIYPSAPNLLDLRANYLGQIPILQFAANWSQAPQATQTCDLDLDLDGQMVCILSSDTLLAIFHPAEGALTHLFSQAPEGPHQWIAPTAQFASGLSDSQNWDTSAAMRADPAVIPGAFADPGNPFTATIEQGRLIFQRPDLEKSYRLTPNGLEIAYRNNDFITAQIPLSIDPWERFTPNWGNRYYGSIEGDVWVWGLKNGSYISISSSAPLTAQAFIATRSLMGTVENPNYEFPPDHYLPFPVSLVEIRSNAAFQVQIELHP